MQKINKGFTLIELLVVISIIAILSTFFINTATINIKRARDARRQSDLELIRSGIETYHADCNHYPSSDIFMNTSLVGDDTNSTCLSTNTYISKIPQDPSPDARKYVYSTSNSGRTYQICAALEAAPAGTPGISCNGSFSSCSLSGSNINCNYEVINP
ncbi:N/A [soil metagenome]